MTVRKKFDQPFNPRIPPLFSKGGILSKQRELGAKIGFMAEMPENHFSARVWLNLYEVAKREMADLCFLEQRVASHAEMSQLDWLSEAGHKLWWADAERPRCNLLQYIFTLEKRIEEMGEITMTEVAKANRGKKK